MAITYGKDKTASQKAADVKARLGKSMDNKKPGYKPSATSKLVVKPKKGSVYIGKKITF